MKVVFLLQIVCVLYLKNFILQASPTLENQHVPVQKILDFTTSTAPIETTEMGILAGIWDKVSHVFSREVPARNATSDLDEKGSHKFHVVRYRKSLRNTRLRTLDLYQDVNPQHKRADDDALSENTEDVTESAEDSETTEEEEEEEDSKDSARSVDRKNIPLREKRQFRNTPNISKMLERAIFASLENSSVDGLSELSSILRNNYPHADVSKRFLDKLAEQIRETRDKESIAENQETNNTVKITKLDSEGKVYEEESKSVGEISSDQKIKDNHLPSNSFEGTVSAKTKSDSEPVTAPATLFEETTSTTLLETSFPKPLEELTANLVSETNDENVTGLAEESTKSQNLKIHSKSIHDTEMKQLLSAFKVKDQLKLMTPLEYAIRFGSLKMSVENSVLNIVIKVPFNDSVTVSERALRMQRSYFKQRDEEETLTDNSEDEYTLPTDVIALDEK